MQARRKFYLLIATAVVLLMLLIGICYKTFGKLGNAFIITIVILAIIYALVEVLFFQGLFLKIARKVGLKLKKTKGGPDVRR